MIYLHLLHYLYVFGVRFFVSYQVFKILKPTFLNIFLSIQQFTSCWPALSASGFECSFEVYFFIVLSVLMILIARLFPLCTLFFSPTFYLISSHCLLFVFDAVIIWYSSSNYSCVSDLFASPISHLLLSVNYVSYCPTDHCKCSSTWLIFALNWTIGKQC